MRGQDNGGAFELFMLVFGILAAILLYAFVKHGV